MINQRLAQKQRLKILPQQIQLLNFFHLNTLELEQRIQQELEENPLLEDQKNEFEPLAEKFNKDSVQDFQDWEEYGYDDIPDYKMEYCNYLHNEKLPERPIVNQFDYRKALKEQFKLSCDDETEIMLAEFVIDSFNDHGIMEQCPDDLAEDISFRINKWIEAEQIIEIIKKIQELEPVGVGARSIRECLLIQLGRMNTKRPDVKMAIKLLEEHFTDLHNRNMDKIKSHLKIDDEEMKIVLKLIASLKMKPICEEQESLIANQNILPDFIIIRNGDDIEIQLYRHRSESLNINSTWKQMADNHTQMNTDKSAVQYLKNKLQSAQWFIHAVQQREATMLKIMKAIVKIQHEYFLTGDINLLKPMILKNVAEMVGVDISTVSRITCNKYAETPFGLILLKDLFTEGIANEKGEVISNRVIQSAIEDVIQSEDKHNPYTDQQLVTILSQKGFSVARRTVAKYREQLQIPVSHVRSLWA
ncbi:RNA polymerase factor sigma-54 [Chitinophagaceae bacterium LB-8]|uniref:RNA polymerase factor sigma-54 n=1 Tax=Paraflavisolibacter caeni TaxID=2982496 RepID=A0A9X2XUX0_9BACT|nr:RNA polymerase factor sigma-54 [Paraflavisolibacter caeni]MCU7549536.1 RNA polymerase factor sigma-54 [Paraflavisolibacter caeni]